MSSPVEREGIYLAELALRVQLLRKVLKRLPSYLTEFAHVRYVAKSSTHSMRETCKLMDITRRHYDRMREQLLTQILAEIYINRLDPGAPFSYCHQDPDPKELRSSY